jgi:signal transduction histidine kinase
VAVPVASGGVVHGAVRVTFPTASLDARVRNAWVRLIGLSVLVLGMVTAVGLLLARGVTRPVRALDEAAERIADGELDARVRIDRGPPEVRRLATTFNRTAARLEHLVTAQERFVADAAHQLRTPLTALRLRLENFEPHLPGPEQPKLTATIDEVQRLSRIVDGLLLLARRDADEPVLRPVDLARATADRVDAWTETAAAQGVHLRAELPDHLWVIAPDDAIEQILDNLVSNAVTASPPGGAITVSVISRPDVGELHVVDQGPGLSDTDRDQAFDRFWRGTTTTPGTGLGLSIVRELASLAGGDAALAPGPDGHGLDAGIRLPLAKAPMPAPAPPAGATSLTQR